MLCPKCNHIDSKVIDSRPEKEGRFIRRRRECESCSFRFSTMEKIVLGNFLVVKSDEKKEDFSLEKLTKSILLACGKRPVSENQIREMVRGLAEKWMARSEVSSKEIGETVMNLLKEIDHIAYIRFASVYRRFKDVEEFKQEISQLL